MDYIKGDLTIARDYRQKNLSPLCADCEQELRRAFKPIKSINYITGPHCHYGYRPGFARFHNHYHRKFVMVYRTVKDVNP
jgi:hypothetical protein